MWVEARAARSLIPSGCDGFSKTSLRRTTARTWIGGVGQLRIMADRDGPRFQQY